MTLPGLSLGDNVRFGTILFMVDMRDKSDQNLTYVTRKALPQVTNVELGGGYRFAYYPPDKKDIFTRPPVKQGQEGYFDSVTMVWWRRLMSSSALYRAID